MNRNFWDPNPPIGGTDKEDRQLVVELCIYSFEHSLKDPGQVRQDVEGAAAIWCQSGINVQASHWEKLGEFVPSEPLDLNSRHLAEDMDTCDALTNEALEQLFNLGRPHCPKPSDDPESTTQSVAVYYIPGARLHNVDFVQGCHRFRPHPGFKAEAEHIILLTDEADARVLAHELGHALFTRQEGLTWINDDPDPNRDPGHPLHNKNNVNLMFPNVPNNPVITTEQRTQAKKSKLVSKKDLAFGFTDNKPFKLGVTFNSLHVSDTSDSGFNDNLETKWDFTVESGVASETKHWDRDGMGAGRHALPVTWTTTTVPMASGSDTLKIKVQGVDVDTIGDDHWELPITHPRGVDLWGVQSSNVPFPIDGEYMSAEGGVDGTIKFKLHYFLSLEGRPTETIFRTLCQ